MAQAVFEHWGLVSAADVGQAVFHLVGESILRKSDTDRLEDFTEEGFFTDLFDADTGYRLIEAPVSQR
jgi:uncharacterized repeat protein (TIGR04138 family)